MDIIVDSTIHPRKLLIRIFKEEGVLGLSTARGKL